MIKTEYGKIFNSSDALIAQLAEHVLGKNEVMGSNPIEGSIVYF